MITCPACKGNYHEWANVKEVIKVKYYVQFTHVRNNKIVDNLGSDGVFILDGRNKLETMKYDALLQMLRLNKVANIDGYRIIKAERFTDEGLLIYEFVRSGAREI